MIRSIAAALLVAFPATAQADIPDVVTDIAPVHSLVSMVMDGVGEPHLILPANTSPHGYAMRPSDARSLQNASILIWVGPDLTPWLEKARENLGPDARDVRLLDVEGTVILTPRSIEIAGLLSEDDHDDEHGQEDDHSHDEDHGHNADHGHDEDHGHDDDQEHEGEHAEADDHEHDHSDASRDPHAWLHPENARVWLGEVVAQLASIDPENAETYLANAKAAVGQIDAAEAKVSSLLSSESAPEFVVYHDAFQYFEAAFGLTVSGALADTDAAQPSVRRASTISDAISSGSISCIFSEPQFADRALKSVSGNVEVAVLDPLGSAFEEGPMLYPLLIESLGDAIAGC